jgi:hypothetical protein
LINECSELSAIKNLRDIIKEMKENFDKDTDPRNWKVIAGRTSNSFNDMFFAQNNKEEDINNLWQIKFENMSPQNILGVGSKIRNIEDDISKKIISKGKSAVPLLFGMLVPQKKGVITAAGSLNYSNKAVGKVKKDLEKTSDKNIVLEKLMKKRLKELIEKENPGRFDMFR